MEGYIGKVKGERLKCVAKRMRKREKSDLVI
jgi:hypothetical protein